jgi:sterol desaturase/sphingolipid hydroxylase (fatty acid hydroxylase superfamily)
MFIILALAIGIICWTLTEYLLHRFLGHEHQGKNFFKAEHAVHHSKANYFAPAYKKAAAALVVSAGLLALLNLALPFMVALAFIVGFVGMYGIYEATHFRYHAANPVPALLFLRKHHFYHHFHNPRKNHGVTTRVWDRVFGTYHPIRETTVRIPRAMSMRWLVEGDELKDRYVGHFKLSGR